MRVPTRRVEPPESILVIKPSSFGDVIHALPAVARLRSAWPDARLDWVINPEWSSLLDDNPSVTGRILFPRKNFRGWKGAFQFNQWCRTHLAANRYDLAIDFQGLLRSAWMGRVGKPAWFVGMSDAREGATWFYDQTADMPKGVTHSVERYLAAADFACRDRAANQEIVFPLPSGEPIGLPSFRGETNFVMLHPFSRGGGKSLAPDHVRQLCQRLAPLPTVIVGRYEGSLAGDLPVSCTNLLNQTTLEQLIWLTRRSAAVVTVDSGPSHLAAALTKPLVAIHTWSDPRKVGPYGDDAYVWKNGELEAMRRMKKREDAFFRQKPRLLQEGDLDAIARLTTALSGSYA